MASADLDLVRSRYARWDRGDWSSIEWAHPEIEFVLADRPEPGSWTGVSHMAKVWREFLSSGEPPSVDVDDYRELHAGRVLVLFHRRGRGKASGLEIEQLGQGANLLHVWDGKVNRFVVYFDRERALVDLGLAPEAS